MFFSGYRLPGERPGRIWLSSASSTVRSQADSAAVSWVTMTSAQPCRCACAASKVNIKGERVALDPAGRLAQAQWAKTRYGMATQTLSNGYCGLPVQKSCPHANPELTSVFGHVTRLPCGGVARLPP